MIFITESPNDDDLWAEAGRLFGGLAVRAPVPCGDFCFYGQWTGRAPVSVTGDRKKLKDVISCMNTGRYLHQAQLAKDAGFDFLFLVVEGVWDQGADGQIVVRRGKDWVPVDPACEYRRLDAFLEQLDLYVGIRVRRTFSLRSTVAKVIGLYLTFQSSPEDHHSLEKIYEHNPPRTAMLTKPSLLRRIAKELPGIGWERSGAAERYFRSVADMITSPVDSWRQVDGIGSIIASNITMEINKTRVD